MIPQFPPLNLFAKKQKLSQKWLYDLTLKPMDLSVKLLKKNNDWFINGHLSKSDQWELINTIAEAITDSVERESQTSFTGSSKRNLCRARENLSIFVVKHKTEVISWQDTFLAIFSRILMFFYKEGRDTERERSRILTGETIDRKKETYI